MKLNVISQSLMLLAVLSLSAQGQEAPPSGGPAASKEKLQGKWKLDLAATAKLAGQDAATVEQVKANDFEITIEFKADGAAEMTAQGFGKTETKKGSWKVTKTEGASLTIEMQQENSTKTDILEVIFRTDDEIAMGPPTKADDANAKKNVAKRVVLARQK